MEPAARAGSLGAGVDEAIVVRIAGGEGGRTDRKRAAIIEAATALFLHNGYQGTSVDDVAARAAVSKQTVYKQFGGKEQLFRAIVDGITVSVAQFAGELSATFADLREPDQLPEALEEFARRYIRFTVRPQVVAVRRLVIGEAARFPELARNYHDRAPTAFLGAVADWLAQLGERGLLAVADAELAANQLGFLVLGQALDRATFCGPERSEADLDHIAVEGARAFLRAYRP